MTDFKALEIDYAPTPQDDDEMLLIKERIMALSPPLRNIWLLYCEAGTYTEVGRILHSSPPTVKKKIMFIKNKILNG